MWKIRLKLALKRLITLILPPSWQLFTAAERVLRCWGSPLHLHRLLLAGGTSNRTSVSASDLGCVWLNCPVLLSESTVKGTGVRPVVQIPQALFCFSLPLFSPCDFLTSMWMLWWPWSYLRKGNMLLKEETSLVSYTLEREITSIIKTEFFRDKITKSMKIYREEECWAARPSQEWWVPAIVLFNQSIESEPDLGPQAVNWRKLLWTLLAQ